MVYAFPRVNGTFSSPSWSLVFTSVAWTRSETSARPIALISPWEQLKKWSKHKRDKNFPAFSCACSCACFSIFLISSENRNTKQEQGCFWAILLSVKWIRAGTRPTCRFVSSITKIAKFSIIYGNGSFSWPLRLFLTLLKRLFRLYLPEKYPGKIQVYRKLKDSRLHCFNNISRHFARKPTVVSILRLLSKNAICSY